MSIQPTILNTSFSRQASVHHASTVPVSTVTPRQPIQQPRFGNLDMVAKTFKLITEEWVWGFFVQDVACLWITRIINALRRGATVYDPNEDPEIRKRKPLEQFLHASYVNLKGLKYDNGLEETLREVETGPGLLIAQSTLFGVASAVALGKASLMMSVPDLKNYRAALAKTLSNSTFEPKAPIKNALALEGEIFHRFLADRLIHDHQGDEKVLKELASTLFPDHFKTLSDVPAGDKALARFLQQKFPQKEFSKVTLKEALESWVEHYARIPHKKGLVDKAYLKRMEHAESLLHQITYWSNENIRKVADPEELSHLAIKGLGSKHHVSTSTFLDQIEKFRPFIRDSIQKAQKATTHAANGKFKTAVIEASAKVMHGVIKRKAALSLIATLAAGITVVSISAIAQRGKVYPANTYLPLNQLNKTTGGGATNEITTSLESNPGGHSA